MATPNDTDVILAYRGLEGDHDLKHDLLAEGQGAVYDLGCFAVVLGSPGSRCLDCYWDVLKVEEP